MRVVYYSSVDGGHEYLPLSIMTFPDAGPPESCPFPGGGVTRALSAAKHAILDSVSTCGSKPRSGEITSLGATTVNKTGRTNADLQPPHLQTLRHASIITCPREARLIGAVTLRFPKCGNFHAVRLSVDRTEITSSAGICFCNLQNPVFRATDIPPGTSLSSKCVALTEVRVERPGESYPTDISTCSQDSAFIARISLLKVRRWDLSDDWVDAWLT